jgi:type I restriction enzyme, S subunit
MKRKGFSTTENTARTEIDAVGSGRSVANTEDLPDGFQMTELGPLPKEWRVARLGEVAEKPQYGFTAAARRDPVGPKILRITDIQDGNVNWNTVPYCECGNDDIPKYLLEAGDILFARTGSVGKTFLVSSVPEPSIFASYLIRVRVDRTKLDPQFAFLFMQSAAYWSQIASQTHGAVQPNVNATQLRSLLLPLPPLPEQRAIAHVLRTVQRAKEATEGVIAALKELKKSLMQHLFTYGPVPVTERERVPLQETEIGPIPAHWRVVRLGEVVEKPQYGFTAAAQRDPVGPKMLRITDIQDGNVDWNAVPYCECGNDDIPKYLLEAGDILLARTGSVGKAFLVSSVPEPSIFASYLIRVRVDRTRLDPQFAFLFMQSAAYWSQIASQTHGAVQPNINATQLRSLLLPLPPLSEQREIARMLQAVDAKIAAEERRRAALEELFKTLLHALMSGRMRVPHIVGGERSCDSAPDAG